MLPLNSCQQYVSVFGNDGNSGFDWQYAKQTIAAALTYLQEKGGGELHIESGVSGNIWLRGDGLVIPGWFGDFPLKVFGHGNEHTQFSMPIAAVMAGVASDRTHPAIWLASTGLAKEFHNLGSSGFWCNQFVRMWDYRRAQGGTNDILWSNVASWTRSGTAATVTLALPPAYSITSASRTGNIVTIHWTATGPLIPLVGQWIRISSTDPHFDSGDFLIVGAGVGGGAVNPTNGAISYLQSTTTGSFSGTTIGTMATHDLHTYDRIEVSSTQANVATSAYRVTATGPDAVTVTLQDVYGGVTYALGTTYAASGTWSNPGQWVLQDRFSFGSSLLDFYNMSAGVSPIEGYDRPAAGPSWDLGGTADGRIRIFNCAPYGYVPNAPSVISPDKDRECWLLVDGGAFGAPGFECYDTRPAAAGIRFYGAKIFTWAAQCVNVLGDTGLNTTPPPAFEVVEGNQYGIVHLEDVRTWDNLSSNPDVVISGGVGMDCQAINCGYVKGPIPTFGSDGLSTESAWTRSQPGFWNGSRIAGNLPHARRASGPIAHARFANIIKAPSTWTTGGNTITTGVADPFGGAGAVKITGSGGYTYFLTQDTPVTPVQGDAWVAGGWFRRAGGGQPQSGFMSLAIVNNLGVYVAGQVFAQSDFLGDGEWEFYYCVVQFASNPLGSSWGIRLNSGAMDATETDFYGIFGFKVPANTLSTNEFWEYVGTLRNHASYLSAGQVGTMQGVPFYADGGVRGQIPAQITAADGNTAIGTTAASFYVLGLNLLALSSTTVIVPANSGKKFMPQSVALRIKTLTGTLTASPKIRIGTNANHDNVAPIYTIGLTSVVDNVLFPPLVNPVSVISIDTGPPPLPVIVEVQTAGTATTMTADVYVTGVYV